MMKQFGVIDFNVHTGEPEYLRHRHYYNVGPHQVWNRYSNGLRSLISVYDLLWATIRTEQTQSLDGTYPKPWSLALHEATSVTSDTGSALNYPINLI